MPMATSVDAAASVNSAKGEKPRSNALTLGSAGLWITSMRPPRRNGGGGVPDQSNDVGTPNFTRHPRYFFAATSS